MFYIVYDQIIPIVDYTNLFIFGITTALAWELPDKPVYPGKQHENDSTPLLQRLDNDVKEDPVSDNIENDIAPPESFANDYNYQDSYYNNKWTKNSNKFDYYFKSNPSNDRLYNQIDRIADKPYVPWRKATGWMKVSTTTTSTTTKMPPVSQRRHFVYAAIGKRSIDARHRSAEEQFYIDHHRSTRHNLYRTIAKYLKA